MEKKSIFLKEIDRVLNSENSEITDSDTSTPPKSPKTPPPTFTPADESKIALLISPQKFHTYLLNSMNIRVNSALSSHFFDQLQEAESEEDDEKDDPYDKDSYNSEDLGLDEAEGEGDPQPHEETEPYMDDYSSRRSDSKSKNRSNLDEQSNQIYRDDTNMSKKSQRKFEDPFKNLPKPDDNVNYTSSYHQMSLATLVMNDQFQKLSEGNNLLKAKIHLLEKQMKTSDPVKKMSFHKQINDLSKPGSLKKYLVHEKYPPQNGGVYQSEMDNFEKWKSAKIQSKDLLDSGFVTIDALKSNELPDSCFPGTVYEGSRYLGTTFTKFKEEKEYFETSNKTEFDKISQNFGPPQSGSLSGRKRRYRRRANQISRGYVCSLPTCRKAYGSEGSLNQHMKIKHPEYYQSSDITGRRRGRIGNRHIGFIPPMQPPAPLNHFQMMQNQYSKY